MGGRHTKLLSTINTWRARFHIAATPNLVSAAMESFFSPFNPLSFLIHASQIRCFHIAESYVSGSAGVHIFGVLIEDRGVRLKRDWKPPLLEREVWGHAELCLGWRRQFMSSRFTIGGWTTYNSLGWEHLTSLCVKQSPRRLARFQNTHLVFVGGCLFQL